MDTKEKIKVMQAYVDGKPIQIKIHAIDKDWRDSINPIWDWERCTYRIKPTRQPLTSADFPPGTIVREKDIPTTWHLVTTVTNSGIYITVHMHHYFNSEWFQTRYEYSNDQGKTWNNCYK